MKSFKNNIPNKGTVNSYTLWRTCFPQESQMFPNYPKLTWIVQPNPAYTIPAGFTRPTFRHHIAMFFFKHGSAISKRCMDEFRIQSLDSPIGQNIYCMLKTFTCTHITYRLIHHQISSIKTKIRPPIHEPNIFCIPFKKDNVQKNDATSNLEPLLLNSLGVPLLCAMVSGMARRHHALTGSVNPARLQLPGSWS